MAPLSVHPASRTIAGPTWRLQADALTDHDDGGWRAPIDINHQLTLLIEGSPDDHETVWVQAWTGEPESSRGVAMISDGNVIIATAAIAICACGDPGCANAGRQMQAAIPSESLADVVAALGVLPTSGPDAQPDRVWQGDLLQGLALR